MAKLTEQEMLQVVEESIKKIENKDFTAYFLVIDTKGNPSGSLEYIYQTAFTLRELGYNAVMIHNDKEFVGVEEWLGKKYADLPHKNFETENVEIGPSDFLFIPEIFANIVGQLKNISCKKIMIVQNYNYLPEFMPISSTLDDMKINDVVTTTNVQATKVKEYFPTVQTHVVAPSIKKVFRNSDKPRKLIINVVSKNQEDVYRIMKPFYWKYPIYKWISFRELRGLDQETLSTALRETPITVCIDAETNFGYVELEALRCGSILLAKIPSTPSDWNLETDKNGEQHLTDACVWFDNIDSVPDMLASIIRTWTLDRIPSEVYNNLHKFDLMFTPEQQSKEIERVYGHDIFEKRLNDLKEFHIQLKNNINENK